MEPHLLIGICIGVLLLVIIKDLPSIYIATRENSSIFLFVYSILILWNNLALLGILTPKDEKAIIQGPLFIATGFFYIFFTYDYVKTIRTSFTKRLLSIYLILFASISVISFFYPPNVYFILGLFVLVVTTCLYIALSYTKKGYSPTRFHFISHSIYLIGIILLIAKNSGINSIEYISFTICCILQITVLTLGYTDRIRIFRKERDDAQYQALAALEENSRIVREQNITLEAKVNERTTELKTMNNELHKILVELKETEANLIQSERLAVAGELSAGIAHEIGNALTYMYGAMQSIKKHFNKILLQKNPLALDVNETEISEMLPLLEDSYNHINYILQAFIPVSKSADTILMSNENINEIINKTLALVKPSVPKSISIKTDFTTTIETMVFYGPIVQVLINIIKNAIDALNTDPDGSKIGNIDITTRKNKNTVAITIQDDGMGMPPYTMNKIFEPFFTTKEVGKGSGLGLSIVYNIIKKHEGDISVESEVGKGTKFTITLPIIDHENQ